MDECDGFYIVVEPDSGYVLSLGCNPNETYNDALNTGLIELDAEPGYRNGKSDFFPALRCKYLKGKKPTRYLVSRFIYF